MAVVAQFRGTRLTAANLITGSGILRGFLISHDQAESDQIVTFYDNTAASGTVLLAIYISRWEMPIYYMFGRDDAIRFSTGLSATYANCEVNVWAIQLT